jgi:hypothetical protein
MDVESMATTTYAARMLTDQTRKPQSFAPMTIVDTMLTA